MSNNNIEKLIKINISDDLPYFAKKHIAGSAGSAGVSRHLMPDGGELFEKIPEITVNVILLSDDFIKKNTTGYKKIDIFYKFFDGGFIEKAKYKFSSWESMVLGMNESMNNFTLAVRGDFFSQWVWPYRTLGNLSRLILAYWGIIPVHAAAFSVDDGATLMLAPSGTGKTLTTINWLCRNNQFYSDDQSYTYNGFVFPSASSISYWAHRYKGNSDAIPLNMPSLQKEEQKKLRIARLLKTLSLGNVGFGASLNVKKYWPGCIAPVKPVKKIIILHKADKFGVIENISQEEAINKIIGDFRFQSLSILRWLEGARLTRHNLFLIDWEQQCRKIISELVNSCQLVKIGIPNRYSQAVYKNLENIIK